MGNTSKIVRTCAVCGKKFKTNIHNKITCSVKCYKKRKAALKKIRMAGKKKGLAKRAKSPVAASKKPVKCIEKVVLPKKPSVRTTKRKECKAANASKIFIDLRNTDPYKLYFAGEMLKRYAVARIGNEAEKSKGKK